MTKTATFSFRSDKYGGIEETETFAFEEIGIDEHMNKEAMEKEMMRILKAWICHKLTISFSAVWDGSDDEQEC